jgi:hypothetical protein
MFLFLWVGVRKDSVVARRRFRPPAFETARKRARSKPQSDTHKIVADLEMLLREMSVTLKKHDPRDATPYSPRAD